MDIQFLTLDQVLAIHRDQIDRYGGSLGLRDQGLLESAIAMPAAQFGGHYAHEFPAEMAAAYLFHIAKNHPFVDGNKRVGAVAARVFLLTNGVHFDPDEQEYERFVLGLAAGELDKADAAEFSREHCQSS